MRRIKLFINMNYCGPIKPVKVSPTVFEIRAPTWLIRYTLVNNSIHTTYILAEYTINGTPRNYPYFNLASFERLIDRLDGKHWEAIYCATSADEVKKAMDKTVDDFIKYLFEQSKTFNDLVKKYV